MGKAKQVQTVETAFNRYGTIEIIGEGGVGQQQRAVQSKYCHAPEAVFNLPLEWVHSLFLCLTWPVV